VYHGGSRPETKERSSEAMAAWGEWSVPMGQGGHYGGKTPSASHGREKHGSVAKDGGSQFLSAANRGLIEA